MLDKKIISLEVLKKIAKLVSSRLFYLLLGLFLAGALAAYAAWSDAQTGGTGELSEANWNALVTQLQTLGPSGWTCQRVSGSGGAASTATCPAGTKLITGGCEHGAPVTYFSGHPVDNGWYCLIGAGYWIQASAWCCQ